MYILQIKDLHKKYGEFEALKGVNLSIQKGEIYGLLGPNGAGKSTLIKCISGLEKTISGEIVFEENITNINKYKEHIGLLPQDIALYLDFTARENISFFCSLYGYKGKNLKNRVDRALEFVGLMEFENKKAKEFSGGMKRRLNMACAIAHSPSIVIMDEPTVGIDPQSRNHILESVKKLNSEGSTIIYTSHPASRTSWTRERVRNSSKWRALRAQTFRLGNPAPHLESPQPHPPFPPALPEG